MRHTHWLVRFVIVLAACLTATKSSHSADEFERPPIEYSKTTPDNGVSRLKERIEQGEVSLKYDDEFGYLRSLLTALDVPIESQMLVFSKTSLQRERISAKRPRAIYFNDDIYVGYCQSGEVIEVSTVDPKLGTVFYTVDQSAPEKAHFLRQTDNCLVCHSSSRTDGVPGHLVRSVFAGPSGHPILSAGSYSVDHTTPLEQRWGGWYVTGSHGSQSHLGNLIVRDREVTHPVKNDEGQNVTRLDDRISTGDYLSPHSDIVALMVLEHQVLVHNCITKANFSTRQALYTEAELIGMLGKPEEGHFESTQRRIQYAGDDLVAALLFLDEAKLTEQIKGTSGFAEKFTARAPRDKQGRSLREFDLKSRLFKYPCSYLIYSSAFENLPNEMRDYVWQRLWNVLVKGEDADKFAHLSETDRKNIVEILQATHPKLPAYWQKNSS